MTDAEGNDFEGCDSLPPVPPPDVCGLPKDRGGEGNFSTRWFYDVEYGGCNRFWFSGKKDEKSNGNNFMDKQSCDEVCSDPAGKDACMLPIVPGPCEGYYQRYGYDKKTKTCRQFVYGGCHGNNNRFEDSQECEAVCTEDDSDIAPYLVEKCSQPIKAGPCAGNFSRYLPNIIAIVIQKEKRKEKSVSEK